MDRLKEPGLRGAHLLAASGFALAQPLFDILGKNAEFFAVRGSTPADIVIFALVITFVPAAVLLAVELLVGLASERAALALHYVFLGALFALFALQALKRIGFDSTLVLVVGGILVGIGIAAAVARVALVRTFMTVLAAAPVVFLCVFLFDSSVTDLVFPGDTEVRVANVGPSAPVVFLLLDEFPVLSIMDENGEIDAGRYPNFARLAASSTWFKNTTTLSASTTVAVPSMLTGLVPKRRKLPVFQKFPRNLFTLLGKDYRMNVTESQTRLCPPQLCARGGTDRSERLSGLYSDTRIVYLHLLSPPALEDRLPAIDESWGEFGNEAAEEPSDSLSGVKVDRPKPEGKTFYAGRIREFETFVDSLKPPVEGQPTLDFLHVLLPHGPWLYFPDGRASAVAAANAPGRHGERWWDDGLANQAHQRHLLQLAYTDALLGEFLDKLEATGLWDKALVLVTADHGISFHGGDDRRAPSKTNLAELAFTPLFIRFPGQPKGRVEERHVTIPDILPTIADGLGIEMPWKVDGSTANEGEGSDTVRVVSVSKPYAEALAQRDADLARQVELFGTGEFGPAFFGLGASPVFGIGMPAGLIEETGEGGTAVVDAAGSRLLRDLPDDPRRIPSPLEATLTGVAKGDQLALALNNRVVAVARAFQDETGPVKVSFLIPEDAFRPGNNRPRIFRVTDDDQILDVETSLSG